MATGRASVDLTTPWLAAATAIVLGVILAVWIVAYKMGESEATVRLAGGVGTAPPRSDPKPADRTAEAGSQNSAPGGAPSETPIGRTDETAEGAGAPLSNPVPEQVAGDPLPKANQTDSGTVVAYTGSYESDPRVPGKNYLLLASSMSRQDARDAVDFLGRNGFAALGVPYGAVDRTGREGKNDPLYKLVSAQGFDSSDMKESQSKREAIATEAGKLGLIYQRQHRGKYNFAKVNWEKYVR